MRKELQIIEQIENYLLDKMESTEKAAFESEMNQSQQLKSNVAFQRNLMTVIRQVGIQIAAKNAGKKYRFKKGMNQIGLGIIIGGVIAIGGYLLMGNEGSFEAVDNSVEISQSIVFPENDSLSSTANKYLDQEVFRINTANDTVIETEDGIVVHIPNDAFNTESKEVDLVIQGAVKPDDILKAGLSTTSNGEALETGGMFYIDAFAKDERVELTKKLTVNVPSAEKKPGMEVYKGEKTADGEINWTSPKPIETFLTPVDISTLDFYPPGYEATLDNWGLYGKEYRDSLYYSFAFADDMLDFCDKRLKKGFSQRKISVQERDFIYGDNRPIDGLMTYEEANILCENGMLTDWVDEGGGDPAIGEKLFKGNCASCHFPDRDMTGPALKGARERWVQNSSEENFYAWIKNSQKVIKSEDDYANQLFSRWNQSVMTPQNVTNEQIDHIFAYVELFDHNEGLDDLLSDVDSVSEERDSFLDRDQDIIGVDPASVQSIWNATFNKTNLATKEFEARMPWIHKSCNTEFLNIYVYYLNSPLYYSDSIISTVTYGEVKQAFLNFAAQKDGKVRDLSEGGMKLYDYYEKKRKANAKAILEAQKSYWNKQKTQDHKADDERATAEIRSINSEAKVFQKEFETNLEKVKKELGLNKSTPINNGLAYTAKIATLGWYNIDRKVSEITGNRKTETIAYEGKESTLTYKSWSATIANADQYDCINVYNIPKKFDSYVKIKAKFGTYNYDLNADLAYSTLVVAWTENSIFFHQDKKTKPGEHVIQLKPITDDEFKNNVAASLSSIANMSEEMNYIEYAQKDQLRVNTNQKKVLLRERIQPVIFPCMPEIKMSEAGHHLDHGHSEEH